MIFFGLKNYSPFQFIVVVFGAANLNINTVIFIFTTKLTNKIQHNNLTT